MRAVPLILVRLARDLGVGHAAPDAGKHLGGADLAAGGGVVELAGAGEFPIAQLRVHTRLANRAVVACEVSPDRAHARIA